MITKTPPHPLSPKYKSQQCPNCGACKSTIKDSRRDAMGDLITFACQACGRDFQAWRRRRRIH